MGIQTILSFFGGIALFLFGISLMGNGLKKVAGDKLETFLYKLTSNPFKGLLLGIGVTAVIQSSSATSIMTIGFVNSGMMKFRQAIAIILGSILGTSITGWIVCLATIENTDGLISLLSTASLTGIIAIIGIYFYQFTKTQVKQQIGEVLMGFAVLMYGMMTISASVRPFCESEAFLKVLTAFANPLLGILAGIVFTSLIQSSAAAIGILQALAMTGALRFSTAFPIMLGIAVGGAVPVLISALGANINGIRTAVVHLLSDVFGAVICGVAFYGLNAIFDFGIMGMTMTATSMALLNSLFRFVFICALFPCIGLLEKLACTLVKDRPDPADPESIPEPAARLEERFIQHPALALQQSHEAIASMAELTRDSLKDAISLLDNYSEEVFQKVSEDEQTVDIYEDKLGSYLLKVSVRELSARQNDEIYVFLHSIADLGRISGHAMKIAESAKEIHTRKISFSDAARRELQTLQEAIIEVVSITTQAFVSEDAGLALKVEPLEDLINILCSEIKGRHIERLQKGECALEKGFSFGDLLTGYEHISDHCANIAASLLQVGAEDLDTHTDPSGMKKEKSGAYMELFEEYQEKYSLEEM